MQNADSKRIYKNTLFLYMRMFLIMVIGFYASRQILDQLGVEDFGIYSVVGGLVMLFAFLNNAISASMQRFISYELGSNGGKNLQPLFGACCLCVLALIVVLFVLAETVGVWFLRTHLSIPPHRIDDAFIVFQFSSICIAVELLRLPYNALIISCEKMSFFAYNSIVEALLKLALVFMLSVIPGTKLLTYSSLLIVVAVLINMSYVLYCRRHIPNVRFSIFTTRSQLWSMAKFTLWNTATGIADVGYMQGTNIVLNLFYGVVYNATMGITNQVKSAVFSFSRNIQLAANPQIIKLYAAERFDEFRLLMLRISKISFFLMLLLGLPIIFNTDWILHLWLTKIPPHAVQFLQLIVTFCMIDSLTGPLWVSMQACGKIRTYQLVTSFMLLLNLPCTYFAFYCGFEPYYLLIIQIVIDIVLIHVRILLSKKYTGITLTQYYKAIVLPLIAVVAVSAVLPYIITLYTTGIVRFFATSVVSVVMTVLAAYYIGINSTERTYVIEFIRKKLHKH